LEIIILALGLSADAFSAAICKGTEMKKSTYKYAALTALMFGIFQAMMPLIGYYLCGSIGKHLNTYSHFIGFLLLVIIGIKMLIESFKTSELNDNEYEHIDMKELLTLSIATSIDALTVGIVLAASNCIIINAVSIIGIITCIMSFLGVLIGEKFSSKFGNKAEKAGGIILISIGIKILLEGVRII